MSTFTAEVTRVTGRSLAARQRYAAMRQAAVNAEALRYGLDRAADAARMVATSTHRAYPQYAGKWDAHVPFVVLSKVTTKLGTAFLPGDVVLSRPASVRLGSFTGRSCYSVRNGIETSLGGAS